MNTREIYNFWMSDSYFDEDTKKELAAIADDEKEIEERFYRDLEFGTGGASRYYRCRNKPYEYLYRTKGDTGIGKLYFKRGSREKRRSNCL